jgi:hypothetical protein
VPFAARPQHRYKKLSSEKEFERNVSFFVAICNSLLHRHEHSVGFGAASDFF